MKKIFLFIYLLIGISCFGSSVHLVNNSPYKLRAVIRGADGSYLGEMILNPGFSNTWSDDINLGDWVEQRPTKSQTPYTVIWHCMDGNDYSICTNVNTGGTAAAQGCDGTRQCKPPANKNPPGQNQPESLLDQKSELPEDQYHQPLE